MAEVEQIATDLADQSEPMDAASLLEQMALDEPLWIMGPTRADIEAFKVKYPNSQIRVAFTTDESGIIWRTLSRAEWRQLSLELRGIEDDEKKEEFLFSHIVLFPDVSTKGAVDALPAGVVPAIMQEFYLHSGFQMVAPSLKL